MLKRLLAAFKSESSPSVPATDPLPPIVVQDEYGRRVDISRTDWHDKILRPQLKRHWNDPQMLSGFVIQALHDGFAVSVLGAARHLADIDADTERGHAIYGMALLKSGKPVESAATLCVAIEKFGPSAMLLTNLAKAEFENGEQAASMATLWRAVEQDPNFENSLMWWLAIQRDEDGETGYLAALRRVAAMPGSWRAQLWLARHALEAGDIDAARHLYQQVLGIGTFDAHALTMMSGDLGNHGEIEAVIELVGPIYNPAVHAPMAGFNLLRAYHHTGRLEQGEALLAKLYALGHPQIKERLDQAAAAFMAVSNSCARRQPLAAEQLQISMRTISAPIWHYGLRNPEWLFANKADDAPQIGFSTLAMPGTGVGYAESQQEDHLGRLTRSIPLYLAECAHYWSDFATLTVITVVDGNGGGPAVINSPEGEELFARIPEGMRWYVTGEITQAGEALTISLHLWDGTTRARIASDTETCQSGQAGVAVLKLERALLRHIGAARSAPVDSFYVRPSAAIMDAYLSALGQSLVMTLAGNNAGSKRSLSGERFMLEWPLRMALEYPGIEVPGLMYLSGLGKAMDYGSDVLPEFRNRTLHFIRNSRPHGAVANLLPIAWKAFDMSHELSEARRLLAADASKSYRDWLDAVLAYSELPQDLVRAASAA
jgi:tetratricopeptide (TPR) repeat protein